MTPPLHRPHPTTRAGAAAPPPPAPPWVRFCGSPSQTSSRVSWRRAATLASAVCPACGTDAQPTQAEGQGADKEPRSGTNHVVAQPLQLRVLLLLWMMGMSLVTLQVLPQTMTQGCCGTPLTTSAAPAPFSAPEVLHSSGQWLASVHTAACMCGLEPWCSMVILRKALWCEESRTVAVGGCCQAGA